MTAADPSHPSRPSSAPAEQAASRRRVLVTGGSGFVGRHVVEAFCARGHHVRVVDLRPYDADADGPRRPEGQVEFVAGDLCDPDTVATVVTPDVDLVVHLAAQTSVLGSIEQPELVYRTNVDVTARLLEQARRHHVEAFVLVSTNAVVGDIGSATITEDLPLAPLTPYGATKAAGEMLASGYAGAFGLRAPMIRLTNVYGPGMGHKDSFVPRLLRAAAGGGEVCIYGDGEQRRDLVYVVDAARAIVEAALSWPTGPVIIGGSRSYTVNEIAQAAREATGVDIRATAVPPKPGEMPAVVVDISRARARGFEPSIGLVEGIVHAWADFASADQRESVDAGG